MDPCSKLMSESACAPPIEPSAVGVLLHGQASCLPAAAARVFDMVAGGCALLLAGSACASTVRPRRADLARSWHVFRHRRRPLGRGRGHRARPVLKADVDPRSAHGKWMRLCRLSCVSGPHHFPQVPIAALSTVASCGKSGHLSGSREVGAGMCLRLRCEEGVGVGRPPMRAPGSCNVSRRVSAYRQECATRAWVVVSETPMVGLVLWCERLHPRALRLQAVQNVCAASLHVGREVPLLLLPQGMRPSSALPSAMAPVGRETC